MLTATCEDGDVKLVGGMSETEGRLEVCFNQRWTTVNGDGWTHSDTQVACRQLGYSASGIKKKFSPYLMDIFLQISLIPQMTEHLATHCQPL